MGLVADIFSEAVLQKLPGSHAIGHTRYSTAGDSALLNAQPIQVDCNKGQIAIAHNGNLVNAAEIRKRFELAGSIFQTSSDTEIVLHLIAQSHEKTLPDAIADALRRIEGAFSFVIATRDHIFAARDPRGFRPLAMGRIPGKDGLARFRCFRLRDLRLRSAGRRIRTRCEAWRIGGGWARGRALAFLRAGAGAIAMHI